MPYISHKSFRFLLPHDTTQKTITPDIIKSCSNKILRRCNDYFVWQVAGVIVGEPIKKENPPCTQYPIHDDEDDVPLDKNIICHFEFEDNIKHTKRNNIITFRIYIEDKNTLKQKSKKKQL